MLKFMFNFSLIVLHVLNILKIILLNKDKLKLI